MAMKTLFDRFCRVARDLRSANGANVTVTFPPAPPPLAGSVAAASVDLVGARGESGGHPFKMRHRARAGGPQFIINLLSGEEDGFLELYGERIIPALRDVTPPPLA